LSKVIWQSIEEYLATRDWQLKWTREDGQLPSHGQLEWRLTAGFHVPVNRPIFHNFFLICQLSKWFHCIGMNKINQSMLKNISVLSWME